MTNRAPEYIRVSKDEWERLRAVAERGYDLAMYMLQSPHYISDGNLKRRVDSILQSTLTRDADRPREYLAKKDDANRNPGD